MCSSITQNLKRDGMKTILVGIRVVGGVIKGCTLTNGMDIEVGMSYS